MAQTSSRTFLEEEAQFDLLDAINILNLCDKEDDDIALLHNLYPYLSALPLPECRVEVAMRLSTLSRAGGRKKGEKITGKG